MARYYLVELLEDAVLGHSGVLGLPAQDYVVHSIQVLLKPHLMDNERGVALLIQLFVFPRHVQIISLVVEQIARGGLLEAHHILRKCFPSRPVEIGGQVLRVVGNIGRVGATSAHSRERGEHVFVIDYSDDELVGRVKNYVLFFNYNLFY